MRQEPERADYQTDLIASLVRAGDRASLEGALAIARRLEAEQKLTADQREWVPKLEAMLREMAGE